MGLGRLSDGLAATPPMGWNSWNAFKGNIDEGLIVDTAEALVRTGMREAGYRYVVIDDGWMGPERDGQGDLVPDHAKFPRGIGYVAERVHALGLRFGIYTDAGTKTCMGLPASLGYEFRDARLFADWGVDFVKVDWCHTDGMGPRTLYAKWALAFAATRRPMILSICEWGRSHPWTWAGTVGHLWRDRILDPVTTVHLFALQILHGNTACPHVPRLGGVACSPWVWRCGSRCAPRSFRCRCGLGSRWVPR